MKRPYLIGIGGGTASGKSTFSAYLEKQLQTYRIMVFHMDSYFKSKEIRPKAKAPVSGKIYLDDNCPETIHHEQLRRDLEAARDGQYDFILVEGLFALWYDWLYEMLDLKPVSYTHLDVYKRQLHRRSAGPAARQRPANYLGTTALPDRPGKEAPFSQIHL